MSTKEFPTMERKKIVPYNGIMRFSRRLSWPDDCEMTGEVTLAISEVTVENRGRSVTIGEPSPTVKTPKYSVETRLSDRLRSWIDIFFLSRSYARRSFSRRFHPSSYTQALISMKVSYTGRYTSFWKCHFIKPLSHNCALLNIGFRSLLVNFLMSL